MAPQSRDTQWEYHPLREYFTEVAICRATAVAATLCVAPFFNSVAFAGALSLGVISLFYSPKDAYYDLHDFLKSRIAGEKFVSRPRIDPVPKGSFVGSTIKKLKERMNIKRPVQGYIMNDEYLFRTMGWMDRKIAEFDPMRAAQKRAYYAYTLDGRVALTKDSINNFAQTPEQKLGLEFILAHELAHIKTQDGSSRELKQAMNSTALYLMGMIATRPVLAVFGIDLQVTENIVGQNPLISSCVSLFTLFNVAVAGNLALNKVSRIAEARADRNALYVTKNLDAAHEAWYHLGINNKPVSLIEQCLSTHPLGTERHANLDRAWAEIQTFEKKMCPFSGLRIPDFPSLILALAFHDAIR